MTETTIPISFEDKKFSDIDLTQQDNWVGTTETEAVINYTTIKIPYTTQYPLIRAIDAEHALIVSARTASKQPNAAILTAEGVQKQFFADDAIEDVIVTDDFLVFTYFDEALASRDMGGQGAAVFDKSGNYLFGLRDNFKIDIVDCYCAAAVRPNTIALLTYPTFRFDVIDLAAKKHTSHAVPKPLQRAIAVSEIGGEFVFAVAERSENVFYRWKLGSMELEELGASRGHVRGLTGGRFLSAGEQGVILFEI